MNLNLYNSRYSIRLLRSVWKRCIEFKMGLHKKKSCGCQKKSYEELWLQNKRQEKEIEAEALF